MLLLSLAWFSPCPGSSTAEPSQGTPDCHAVRTTLGQDNVPAGAHRWPEHEYSFPWPSDALEIPGKKQRQDDSFFEKLLGLAEVSNVAESYSLRTPPKRQVNAYASDASQRENISNTQARQFGKVMTRTGFRLSTSRSMISANSASPASGVYCCSRRSG